MAKKILVLHDPPAPPREVEALAAAMGAQGAEVVALACAEPYDAVLDAVAAADTVLFWR